MKWICSWHGEMKNAYKILVGKPEGKRPLGSSSRRWKDNIKTDLREMIWMDADWIHLVGDRVQWRVVVNTVMKPRLP
jgi:hypothetical protein